MSETKIDLTTDFNPGDDYPDGPYTHMKAMMVRRDSPGTKILLFDYVYGTLDSGNFVASSYPRVDATVESTNYDLYKAMATLDGETIGEAQERCCNKCLVDFSIVDGTLV